MMRSCSFSAGYRQASSADTQEDIQYVILHSKLCCMLKHVPCMRFAMLHVQLVDRQTTWAMPTLATCLTGEHAACPCLTHLQHSQDTLCCVNLYVRDVHRVLFIYVIATRTCWSFGLQSLVADEIMLTRLHFVAKMVYIY